ncbi:hypothetical protein MtrunA17_Chr1g0208741 [Medicago truncatula]|uniref:Transmembrane protein n=1 Tax=Medicago truncatula TaxID=3880 RepID=A0A396JVY4_MEDTR|nr:hypothetical protein MtrunA17_Chr1g0208741 [Medicago truncatula]
MAMILIFGHLSKKSISLIIMIMNFALLLIYLICAILHIDDSQSFTIFRVF